MRYANFFNLLAATLIASGAAHAGAGLFHSERAGLGLKPETSSAAYGKFGVEAARAWQARSPSDFALYGGTRDRPQSRLHSVESYVGVVYAWSGGWGSSLEAGYLPETLVAPRSYALSGQLLTELGAGKTLSIGIQYRIHDTDTVSRFGMGAETTIGNGYTLAPYRVPGVALAPSYQLQFSYQHSAASSFGMALGRDAETFTPYSDILGNGPRQFTFTGQHWLTPSWALSYDVLSQDAMTPLRSLGLRLGVRYKF